MKFIKILFMSCFIFFMLSCKNNNQVQLKNENTRKYNQQKILVSKNIDTVLIDGIANEKLGKNLLGFLSIRYGLEIK